MGEFQSGVNIVAEFDARTGSLVPTGGLTGLTHLIYGLHAFSAITGLLGAAFVVTTFLSGWPSIIAVILNYVKRSDVRGTFLESHFRWQIRTFWFALLWGVIALLLVVVLAITVIGLVIPWTLAALIGIWVLYRIIRGWLALLSGRPMPMPGR
jgi:uncharacterized membrane protein